MKVIIVGAGGTTRALLSRLGESWDATVVDIDPDRLALAAQIRDIETVTGDGTSRVLLDRLPLQTADAVVAAANDDEVNLELCRLAQEAGVARIVATAAASERLPDYRSLEIPAFAPGQLAAHRLGLVLDTGSVVSALFADGKAQAIEVRITEDSPVAGADLAALQGERWVVAAIVRDGQLIVPHGGTQLLAGDLVTVVAAASDHSLVVRTFSSGLSLFPADWGSLVVVAVGSPRDLEDAVPEAAALVRNSSAAALLVVHQDAGGGEDAEGLLDGVTAASAGVPTRFRSVRGSPGRALGEVCAEESVALLVTPAPRGGGIRRRIAVARALRDANELGVPVLFARGATHYSQVVVELPEHGESNALVRAAVDLAASSGASLTGVAAIWQSGGQAIRGAAQEAVVMMRAEAAALRVPAKHVVKRGIEARVIAEESEADTLTVLPMPARAPTPFQLGTAGRLVADGPSSVLLIPEDR